MIQLLAELDRVTRDTTFNEIAVLDGSFADRRFQIGTHEREFAQLSVSSMLLMPLGHLKPFPMELKQILVLTVIKMIT